MFSTGLPLLMIGYTIILLTRVGWPAFIGMGLFAIVVPLINWVSSLNGDVSKEINYFKDQRVQTTA